jgi:hypothetical protein
MEGLAMFDTYIRTLLLAALAIGAAAMLSGCGTAPRPFSFEEKFWFEKAKGNVSGKHLPEPPYLPHEVPAYDPYRLRHAHPAPYWR